MLVVVCSWLLVAVVVVVAFNVMVFVNVAAPTFSHLVLAIVVDLAFGATARTATTTTTTTC